jgi:uncharacterized secreted protein with C-terminal beta-propeller domain
MNIKQLRTLAVALLSLILVLSAGSAIAANQDEMKAGKKAEIALSSPAQVGDIVLPAGKYVFQHVVSAGQHVAVFVGPMGTASRTTIKVKCTNEVLNQKLTRTSVTVENVDGADKVTRIEIAGENVAHIL